MTEQNYTSDDVIPSIQAFLQEVKCDKQILIQVLKDHESMRQQIRETVNDHDKVNEHLKQVEQQNQNLRHTNDLLKKTINQALEQTSQIQNGITSLFEKLTVRISNIESRLQGEQKKFADSSDDEDSKQILQLVKKQREKYLNQSVVSSNSNGQK